MPAVLSRLNMGGAARVLQLPGAIQPTEPERKEEAIAPANTIWSLSGTTPATNLGIPGDYAIDYLNSLMYGPKLADNAWPAPKSIIGAPGFGATYTTMALTLQPVGSSYTFTVVQGLAFPVGMALAVSDGTHWLMGHVTAGGGTTQSTDTLTVVTTYQSSTSGTIATNAIVSFGCTGAQGNTGATGATGAQGIQGLNAYQVAVANGYAGTQTQWLASLVGSQGPQGVAGPAGLPSHRRIQVVPSTSSGTLTCDWSSYDEYRVTLTANTTFTFSGALDGQGCVLKLQQDATGNRTVTLPSGTGGVRYNAMLTEYLPSTSPSMKDKLGFQYDGTDSYYDFVSLVPGIN